MFGKSRIASIAAAAAMTGLIGGAALTGVGCKSGGTEVKTDAAKNSCAAGKNACAGKGACKTAEHDCNGKNSCHGKGGGPAAQ